MLSIGRNRIRCRPRRPDCSGRLACYRPAWCCRRPRRPIPATRVLFVGAEVDPDALIAVRVDLAAMRAVVQWVERLVGPGVPILACPRVGGQRHVPPDWITGTCWMFGCGKAVWVSPRVAGRCGGVGEVAMVCVDHILASKEVR
jgi:hypothetical protein